MTSERLGPEPGSSGPDENINSTCDSTGAGLPFVPTDLPLAAALQHAARGWPVLPVHSVRDDGSCTCGKADCTSPGKHPATSKGVLDAATAEGLVQNWWGRNPAANVGIATGPGSGLFVLDVDPRHGGDDTLEALEEAHGRLPATVEVITGGGGRHLYFRHPGGRALSKTVGPGLDVKADGGFVVAPPSLHLSGRRYEWESSSLPGMVPLVLPPSWLVALVRGGPGKGTSTAPATMSSPR